MSTASVWQRYYTIVSISSQLHVQCLHIGSLKSAMGAVFTQWKLAGTLYQVLIYGFADCLKKVIEKMFIMQIKFNNKQGL